MLRRLRSRDGAIMPMTAPLVVCSTWRFSKQSRADSGGRYGAAHFVVALLDDVAQYFAAEDGVVDYAQPKEAELLVLN